MPICQFRSPNQESTNWTRVNCQNEEVDDMSRYANYAINAPGIMAMCAEFETQPASIATAADENRSLIM